MKSFLIGLQNRCVLWLETTSHTYFKFGKIGNISKWLKIYRKNQKKKKKKKKAAY